ETYEKLGHSYDGDGYCETCGEQDPTSIDYSGYYYIAFKRSAGNYFYVGNAWDSSRDRYVATDSALTELPSSIVEVDMGYVFSFVRNDDASYTIYEGKGGKLFAGEIENVNLTANENGTFSITDSNGVYFSFNNSTGNNYIKWYTSVQVREFTLIKVELNANIDSASITVGADLTLNYYVTMVEVLAEDAKMYITVGENEEEEYTYTVDGDRYKFSLNIPPQCMADLITATLKSNGLVLDTVEYSIQTYAQNKLNESSSDELKRLVSDMLYYGAAAQNYKDYNTGSLATDGVENLIDASDAVAPEVSASPVKNPEIDSYPVYFTGATVWFDGVNKIRVKVNSIENAFISINGGEKTELESTTYETDGILATEFDKEFTFQLYYGETLMQTLTYSVNAYAYKMKDHESMGDLATALYRYGVSAEAYIA
ncbi:MAG: hypothetical protein J6A63_00835, partial [Clostridia bacterium]|nr:hypothetical protein [Clostridia bacterium]